jgi:hypothetical protein
LIEITEPSQKSLNPMKQSGKKIGDEEGIGKDQCPTDYSFKVDINFSSLSRFVNSKKFFPDHLSLLRQFCKKRANLWNN